MTQMTSEPDLGALMDRLKLYHGKHGMRAIADFMHSIGSGTVLCFGDTFPDVKWFPCDGVMQMAWERGGKP